MSTPNAYVTRDLYLAAVLQTLKFEIVDLNFQIEGKNPNPVGYFTFEKTPELSEAESLYFKGDLRIEPREFVSNMRALKSRISNASKSPFSQSKS
jgi:hypothetical protein